MFEEYVGSVEAQELAARESFRLPARTDIPPEHLPQWARDVLHDLVPADVDWGMISAHGQEWMTTWDHTVRSRGGAAK
jgi:hypothetical protein